MVLTGGDDGLMGVPSPDIQLFGWSIGNTGNPTHIYLADARCAHPFIILTRRIITLPLRRRAGSYS